MKIAVISDIHGNMDALNAVMEDINNIVQALLATPYAICVGRLCNGRP